MKIKQIIFQNIRAWIPEEPIFPERLKKSSQRVWLFWLTMVGMIIGILGSIALNQEAIMIGLIFGVGGLFSDSYLERKEEIQEQTK